ncbi:MAG: putative Ferredoxin--NAD(+) reductase [Patescibacteria group bacterium]|nr:putative Ferredoxin--NAD(+) reductase [Patescibacteria group bacterium]
MPVAYPQLLSARRPILAIPKLGWPLIAIICLIPSLVLCVDVPIANRFGDIPSALLTFGDITGVIGLATYVLNLVLATRLRWLEDLFGGLNRVFVAHQILGGLSLVTLLIHPMFSAASYYPYGIRVMSHFFIPQVAYIGTAFGIVALTMIIVLLVLSFYVKIGYKVWLQTHKYLGLAYLLIGLHILLTPNRITADPFITGYLWVLFLAGLVSFIYRTLLPNIFVRSYLYTISLAERKGVGAVEVTLIPVDKMIRFKAGQFIFIAFGSDGISSEWHPFSISSAETSGRLMIDVKSMGGYTETLTRLLPHMIGMTARVEGAYGRFSYRNFGNLNQVWIAGGIGITPFLSMAQTLGTGPYNVDLYYSVKTKSELIDLDTLAVHQSNNPGQVFRVFPFVTDAYNTFLNAEIIASNSGDLTKRDFLLCGPPPMMQSIKKQLMTMGVKASQIHTEEFSL